MHDEGDVCNLPEEAGECDDYVIQWSYNAAESHCKAFYYGGCGGNGNRFASQEDCESSCINRKPPAVDHRGKYS